MGTMALLEEDQDRQDYLHGHQEGSLLDTRTVPMTLLEEDHGRQDYDHGHQDDDHLAPGLLPLA